MGKANYTLIIWVFKSKGPVDLDMYRGISASWVVGIHGIVWWCEIVVGGGIYSRLFLDG